MIRTLLAATAALSLTACDMVTPSGGDATGLDIPEVENGDLSEATMIDVTRQLSSDEFEGRMPGTIGEEKTVALLIEKFQAAGLSPGNGDSWVQQVPLVEQPVFTRWNLSVSDLALSAIAFLRVGKASQSKSAGSAVGLPSGPGCPP